MGLSGRRCVYSRGFYVLIERLKGQSGRESKGKKNSLLYRSTSVNLEPLDFSHLGKTLIPLLQLLQLCVKVKETVSVQHLFPMPDKDKKKK